MASQTNTCASSTKEKSRRRLGLAPVSYTLREFLADVMAGKAIVRSHGELELLRRVASFNELEKLSEIEREFNESQCQGTTATLPIPTKAGTQRIIREPSSASMQELQAILAYARQLRLCSAQIDSIRFALSNLSAER